MNQQDPRRVFDADQAEAGEEYATRERQAHALNVRNGEAQALTHEMHATKLAAQADLIRASSGVVALLGVVATLHGLKRLVTRR